MAEPVFSLRKEDLVTLLVGPHEEEFAIHESCITRNSDFFRAALKREVEGCPNLTEDGWNHGKIACS